MSNTPRFRQAGVSPAWDCEHGHSAHDRHWALPGIEAHLRQRLPARFRHHSAAMARMLDSRFPGRAAPDPRRIADRLLEEPEIRRIVDVALRNGLIPDDPLTPSRFNPPARFDALRLA